jgi:hypothetical protein
MQQFTKKLRHPPSKKAVSQQHMGGFGQHCDLL